MIIFGTRRKIIQLAMLTLVCGNCGNTAAQRLDRVVTKFALFFVPLFPISTKHFMQCSFCGATQRLTKEQAEQAQHDGNQG
ncbi:zinc-ribbon domain-containing protein [Amycolatopsis antarctica]|uniref:Zinc-ribbon domain-containing protein n=1 Tax=Amycolatopsis antarctica TaxID=1854586 RepID=A0A263DBA3_9PSEU|nr:zinc-ribbon domain-containing protein [Amycolatopsis antarctica]OZM74776.1 zinc-ribbon domain-containing protein [Amycolatopsis antarctica]